MRKTTKMFVAQNVRKRDGRGRFTSEGGGGSMNGGYRMDGGIGMNGDYMPRSNEDYWPHMNDRTNDRRRNGSDGERTENRMGGRVYDGMDEEEDRIGFRTRPYMGNEHERGNVISYTRHGGARKGFTSETADEWTRAMHNEDGTKGPHWTREQIKQVMAQSGVSGIEPSEFWAVMNSLYSDYCKVAKKYGVDKPDFYAELTKAWLDDKDAVDDKAAAYFNHVVKH